MSDWRQSLPEDLRNSPSLEKFDNAEGGPVAALAKAYVNLEPKIAEKGVILPKPSDGLQAIRDTFTALGCPPAPDQYDPGLPEGAQIDEGFLNNMRQIAWQHGASSELFQALAQGYHADFEESIAAAQQAAEDSYKQSERALQEKWGGAYSANLQHANEAAAWMFGEEGIEALRGIQTADGQSILNHPAFAEGLAKIGAEMRSESGFSGGTPPPPVMSKDEAQRKLTEMHSDTEAREALRRRDHPAHQEMVNLRQSLYATLEGDVDRGESIANSTNISVKGDQVIQS